MHHSKLPLTAWFWAAYLMATHSNGIITSGNLSRFYINGTVIGGNDAVYVPYPGFSKVGGTYNNISLNHSSANAFGATRIVGAEIGRYDNFTSSPNYNLKIVNAILLDMTDTFFDSGGALTANTLRRSKCSRRITSVRHCGRLHRKS